MMEMSEEATRSCYEEEEEVEEEEEEERERRRQLNINFIGILSRIHARDRQAKEKATTVKQEEGSGREEGRDKEREEGKMVCTGSSHRRGQKVMSLSAILSRDYAALNSPEPSTSNSGVLESWPDLVKRKRKRRRPASQDSMRSPWGSSSIKPLEDEDEESDTGEGRLRLIQVSTTHTHTNINDFRYSLQSLLSLSLSFLFTFEKVTKKRFFLTVCFCRNFLFCPWWVGDCCCCQKRNFSDRFTRNFGNWRKVEEVASELFDGSEGSLSADTLYSGQDLAPTKANVTQPSTSGTSSVKHNFNTTSTDEDASNRLGLGKSLLVSFEYLTDGGF